MFEGIHFYHLNLDSPAGARQIKKMYESVESPDIPEELEKYYNSQSRDVRFLLQGENRIIYPRPITDYARKHFLYLQTFGLLDATPLYFTRRQNYNSFLLLFTYAGKGELEYDGKRFELAEGDGFLIDCMKPHYYHTLGTHWNHCLLHFNGADAHYLFEKYLSGHSSPVFFFQGQALFQEKLEKVIRTAERLVQMREYNTSLALGDLLSYLISEHKGNSKSAPDYIIYLQRYLESNFSKTFTLDELAGFACVSKYHLVREFKKYTGFSPIDYLIELRLERAKFLLKNSSLPIEKIAVISGFSSYANFLKAFKTRQGQTPAGFRA